MNLESGLRGAGEKIALKPLTADILLKKLKPVTKKTKQTSIAAQLAFFREIKNKWSALRSKNSRMLERITKRGYAETESERKLIANLIATSDAIIRKGRATLAVIREFGAENSPKIDMQELKVQIRTADNAKNYYGRFL